MRCKNRLPAAAARDCKSSRRRRRGCREHTKRIYGVDDAGEENTCLFVRRRRPLGI